MPIVRVPCCWHCTPGPSDTAVCKRVCSSDLCGGVFASAALPPAGQLTVVVDHLANPVPMVRVQREWWRC